MSADADDFLLDPAALAIQEQFLEEWRAGQRPRLSVYARRYPAYADALAALVATLPPDGVATSDEAVQGVTRIETTPESFPDRLWMGEGVGRALRGAFGEQAATVNARWLPRVAEERQAYDTRRIDDAFAQLPADAQPARDDDEPADD